LKATSLDNQGQGWKRQINKFPFLQISISRKTSFWQLKRRPLQELQQPRHPAIENIIIDEE